MNVRNEVGDADLSLAWHFSNFFKREIGKGSLNHEDLKKKKKKKKNQNRLGDQWTEKMILTVLKVEESMTALLLFSVDPS